jgi:hypothetical protein
MAEESKRLAVLAERQRTTATELEVAAAGETLRRIKELETALLQARNAKGWGWGAAGGEVLQERSALEQRGGSDEMVASRSPRRRCCRCCCVCVFV